MNEFTEADLVRELGRGNEDAFSDVYRRFRDSVYGFAYRMTYDKSVAEDITHETFVFLIENPGKFDPERGSLRGFLCGVARGRLMNLFRRSYRRDETIDDSAITTSPSERGNPLSDLLSQELGTHVEASIALLPEAQREIFILREFYDLSYEELARVTRCEVATVKTRLHRARQAMARALAGYVNPVETRKYHEVC